jgi:hypothetical protein
MNNMLHSGPLRRVQKIFTLTHHVDGVARDQKGAIHTFQGRSHRLGLVEVEMNDGNS